MAKKVGSNFTPKVRERKYDFERMGVELTGEVFLLEKNSDYQCSEGALRGHIRAFARERNLQYASQIRRDGKRIVGVEVAFAPAGVALPSMNGDPQRERAAHVAHSETGGDGRPAA